MLQGGQIPQLSSNVSQLGGLMKQNDAPLGTQIPTFSELMMQYQNQFMPRGAFNSIEQPGGGNNGNGIGNVSGVPHAAKMPGKSEAEDNETMQSDRVWQI